MKSYKLPKPTKVILRRAHRGNSEDYFVSLSMHERRVKWIRANNRYRARCVAQLEGDLAPPPSVDTPQLAAYIAASAPTHVIDGWSFLGRSVDSLLRGDTYSAIHFAYYAELRAAMGLLASEGIGIFIAKHSVIDSAPQYHIFQGAATHKIIWPVLRYWSHLPRAAERLDDVVTPGGIALSQWLSACGVSLPMRALASLWLRCWGLDLKSVGGDHNYRNLVSYRPSEFRKPPPLDTNETAGFVQELWRLFEPGGPGRFPAMERMLLRMAVQKYAPSSPTAAQLRALGLTALEAADWAAFLAATDTPAPLLMCGVRRSVEHQHCHLGVLSRASLLLFLATAFARRLLTNAAYTPDTVSFWWTRFGESRGLWVNGNPPENPLDQWADIALSLESSEDWRAANAQGSLREWRRADGDHADDLGALELVGIWGLLP